MTEAEGQMLAALRWLASRCDGAATEDGSGFSKFDAGFGRSLSQQGRLSLKQQHAAYKMLRKYKGQLLGAGIDFDKIPAPDPLPEAAAPAPTPRADTAAVATALLPPPPPAPGRQIAFEEGHGFTLEAPYNPDLVAATKQLLGARWDGKNGHKLWRLPATGSVGAGLPMLGARFQIALTPAAARRCAELESDLAAAGQESAATDSDELPPIPELAGELRPFQRAGVLYAIKRKRVLIADEMGLGKTVQAIAAALALEAFPVLVVCPASLKRNWLREWRMWAPRRSVGIIEAGSEDAAGILATCEVVIINYDLLARFQARLARRKWAAIVGDEFHYCKNHKAQRAVAFRELAKPIPVRLGLTGSPILNRPQELTTPLQILGRLDDMGGFWGFLQDCGLTRGKYGLEPIEEPLAAKAARLALVNAKLRATCMVRRLKKDVLKELPPKQRTAIPLPLTNRAEYDRASRGFLAWLEQQDLAKATRASRAEQLARIEGLSQLAVAGKLAAASEWIRNFLDGGEKLVLFAHHIAVQHQLAALLRAEYGPAAVVTIFGENTGAERDAAVQAFQHDAKVRVAVLSIKAGGVGLTLTAASNVAFVEFGWTPGDHDQAEDRCHRIGQHDAVNCWYLLGEDTIDEERMHLVEGSKRTTVKAITDGIVPAAGDAPTMLDSLLARLKSRAA